MKMKIGKENAVNFDRKKLLLSEKQLESCRRNGFLVLDNFLSQEELSFLQNESQQMYLEQEIIEQVDRLLLLLKNKGCVFDVMALCNLPDTSPARMNADAYFKARQQYAPSNSMDSSFFEQLLLFRLPTIASQLLPQSDENLIRDVFLFNENYVVKPPQSHVEFRWHRDEDEQLAMCLNREQIKPYISAWCALDKVTKLNGALRFVPLHSSASYGKESKDIESDEPDEQTQRLEEQATLPLEVDAGTVIFFLSNVWHCSSANDSTSSLRRAFYTQYSSHVITSSYNDPTPLSFGVRCHLFDDSDRGLIANRKEESIKTKKKQRVSKCLKR